MLLFIYIGFYISSSVSQSGYAGMYTPYALIPGGGERYFLTSAKAFQNHGYNVDILVNPDNPCQNQSFLSKTADSLRIKLDYTKLTIKTIRWGHDYYIESYHNSYEVFYALGNSKFPFIRAIGKKLNIYMCQFPFDMYYKGTHKLMRIFSEYDIILVNSMYTYDWYAKLMQNTYAGLIQKKLMGPSVKILYPPVDPFPVKRNSIENSTILLSIGNNSTVNDTNTFSQIMMEPQEIISIIMIGRFFVGRQSKGHDKGIEIFAELLKKTNVPLHLYLVGNIHPSPTNFEYVANMKKLVKEHKLPVTILSDAKPFQITKVCASQLTHNIKLFQYDMNVCFILGTLQVDYLLAFDRNKPVARTEL
jgi:hypothetical protein